MGLPYLSRSAVAPLGIDHRVWTTGKSFLGFGIRFGLRANHAQGLEQVLAAIPLGWEEIPNHEMIVRPCRCRKVGEGMLAYGLPKRPGPDLQVE